MSTQHIPSNWPPCSGEEEDIDTDECNGSLLRRNVQDNDVSHVILGRGCCPQNSDQKLRDGHSDGTPKQHGSSSPFVNSVQTGESGDRVDEIGDQAYDEGILETRVLEELGAVVEDEIDTRQLL